jgi:hypothetical protein
MATPLSAAEGKERGNNDHVLYKVVTKSRRKMKKPPVEESFSNCGCNIRISRIFRPP